MGEHRAGSAGMRVDSLRVHYFGEAAGAEVGLANRPRWVQFPVFPPVPLSPQWGGTSFVKRARSVRSRSGAPVRLHSTVAVFDPGKIETRVQFAVRAL